MTRDDIIRMAREVGLAGRHPSMGIRDADMIAIERFAALVAAAEREECADLIERTETYSSSPKAIYILSQQARNEQAKSIRERGEVAL